MANPTYTSQNYSDQNGNEEVIGGIEKVLPGAYILEPTQDNVVAKPGGGQAGATQITAVNNRLTTVATAGDSFALPPSQAGMTISVLNSTANAAQAFGVGADTVNGAAAATGSPLIAGKAGTYKCYTAGAWFSN